MIKLQNSRRELEIDEKWERFFDDKAMSAKDMREMWLEIKSYADNTLAWFVDDNEDCEVVEND
jgi:hypothetical protein